MPDPSPRFMPVFTDKGCFVCQKGTFRIMTDAIGVRCDNKGCGSTVTWDLTPIPFLKEEPDE